MPAARLRWLESPLDDEPLDEDDDPFTRADSYEAEVANQARRGM